MDAPLTLFFPLSVVGFSQLRDVFFGSRTVYLVMELCKGGELFDEVTRKAQRGMPEATAERMVRTTRTHVNLPVT
jgi:serine/threonine protein kinase